MHRIRTPLGLLLLLTVLLGVAALRSPAVAQEPRPTETALRATYARVRAKLDVNTFGVPIYVESADKGGRVDADVYGIFDHGFETLQAALRAPPSWCEIAALHPNVKAATYKAQGETWLLTLYCGRKVKQDVKDASPINYSYRIVEDGRDCLDVLLSSGDGPYGTRDHRMRFEALRLEGNRVFVHVKYGYEYGMPLRLAEKLYFATVARDKVGFTVERTDASGQPVYVTGPRGALERNAVRYYFAIESFLDNLGQPQDARFGAMLSEWYDLTSRFKRQLFESKKGEYTALKLAEYREQLALQRELAALP